MSRLAILLLAAALSQAAPQHGVKPKRLIVRNALIVEGNGTPPSGPRDIVIEDGVITGITAPKSAQGGEEIDAAGRFVLPGLINLHGHTQDERAGVSQDVNYCLKLWLACGITTVRDVGSDTKRTLAIKEKSARGEIAAPRLFVYPVFGRAQNAEEARVRVRDIKAQGADGIKTLGIYRDVMKAMLAEAHKLGLPVAHHVGVEETNAWDDIQFGTTSIEHWYGIPDAAIDAGVQNFPATYNYSNEFDRFRYAGRLWREANWDRLLKVFDGMIQAEVAWDPTLDIYDASRDLQRAQTQPQFAAYLHPALEEYFRPNLANHGSYFIGWSSTDETYWKENYRIWMRALLEFERRGGLIGMGEDAGFIYQMYGYGLIRGLELHQEAGFHPLKVIQQATSNGAKILKQESRLGRIRTGYAADLIIVNGNPLDNLKVLYPTYETGGIEWTIKDGIPYRVEILMKEVKSIVDQARAKRGIKK